MKHRGAWVRVVAFAALAGTFAAPVTQAKTRNVTITVRWTNTGNLVSGSPFTAVGVATGFNGRGAARQRYAAYPPSDPNKVVKFLDVGLLRLKYPRGTVWLETKLSTTGTLCGCPNHAGTWKVVRGNGKFKGASGTGEIWDRGLQPGLTFKGKLKTKARPS